MGDLSLFIKKRGEVSDGSVRLSLAGSWGGLNETVVRHCLGQLASAMEFLRLKSVIHRDLKPQVVSLMQNILLVASSLSDWANHLKTLSPEDPRYRLYLPVLYW